MKTSIIIFYMLVFVNACTKPKTLTKAEEEAILKEAQQVSAEMLNKLETNDTAALFTIFSQKPGSTFILGDQVYNQDEFKQMARGFLGNLDKQKLEKSSQSFTVLDNNTFILNWKGLNKAYQKSGVVIIWDPIVLSYIFQKDEVGWKIIYGHEGWVNMKVDSSMVKK